MITPIILEFTLKEKAHVRIDVFDNLGCLSGTLLNDYKEAGSHNLIWDGSGMPIGIYYYQLRAGDYFKS
jgi:hypothetical protein